MKEKILKSLKALGQIFGRKNDASETIEDNKSEHSFKKKQGKKKQKEALKPLATSPRPKIKVKPSRSTSISGDEILRKKQTKKKMTLSNLERIFDNVKHQHLNVSEETSIFENSDVEEYHSRLSSSNYGVSSRERDKKILVLGVDFGSTCSKVVVRFPYETIGNAPEAIPAVPCMADETNPYYWKSEVFRDQNGMFSLIPNNSSVSCNDLKMPFIRRAESGKTELTQDDLPVIAYLALMVKQSLGWACKNHSNFLIEDVTAELNFGFPTDSFEQTVSLKKFKKVLSIVTKIIEDQADVSLIGIKKYIELSKSQTIETETRFSVIPEIVAAVTGFANSNESKVGEYIIVDIGGLSIDYAFFKIREYPSSKEINFGIIAAGSKKYGVEILKNSQRSDTDMSQLLYYKIMGLLRQAFDRRSNPSELWLGKEIPVFFTGGGRNLPAYCTSIGLLNEAVKLAKYSRKGETRDIHRFYGLDHSKVTDRVPNRLVVSYGLSFPELEIPDWYTPSQHKVADQSPVLDLTSTYIGPEQV
jgi:hypothetical protein